METAGGYKMMADDGSGVSAVIRFEEAAAKKRTRMLRKNRRLPGGVAERYEQRLAAVVASAEKAARNQGSQYLICPDCAATFSRGYISTHRRVAHGVVNPPAVRQHYLPADPPVRRPPRLKDCKYCGQPFSGGSMSRHISKAHPG